MFASALALFPTLTLAGPTMLIGRKTIGCISRSVTPRRILYTEDFIIFNGVAWVFAPVPCPYGGLAINGDYVYQKREVSNELYPYAIPTSNPDIVISPFALNNLVDVTGIPSGARVRDPVSEEIFLRP